MNYYRHEIRLPPKDDERVRLLWAEMRERLELAKGKKLTKNELLAMLVQKSLDDLEALDPIKREDPSCILGKK